LSISNSSVTGGVIGGRKGEGGDVVTLRAVGQQRGARAHGMARGAQRPTKVHSSGEHRDALRAHLLGDPLGRLGNDDLVTVGERDDRVGRRLDDQDQLGVELEGLQHMPKSVQGDHCRGPREVGVSGAQGGRTGRGRAADVPAPPAP